jgi:hypothetical protein
MKIVVQDATGKTVASFKTTAPLEGEAAQIYDAALRDVIRMIDRRQDDLELVPGMDPLRVGELRELRADVSDLAKGGDLD